MKTDKRTDRISKNTKEIVTIDQILTKDDVAGVIGELIKNQCDITDLIVIFNTRQGKPNCSTTLMEFERVNFLLDYIKHKLFELQSTLDEEAEA